MRYRWGLPMWGNHSQPGRTSFHGPRPPLRSPQIRPPSTYTPCRLNWAKGRGASWRQLRPSAWARSFCFRVWWLMWGSVGLDPRFPASSAWPDMEGLAGELPVAPVCHSVSAGAWSRWTACTFLLSLLFFFQIVSQDYLLWNAIQENILLDVCVTKSMCWGYVFYMMRPVTVFKQISHDKKPLECVKDKRKGSLKDDL